MISKDEYWKSIEALRSGVGPHCDGMATRDDVAAALEVVWRHTEAPSGACSMEDYDRICEQKTAAKMRAEKAEEALRKVAAVVNAARDFSRMTATSNLNAAARYRRMELQDALAAHGRATKEPA